LTQRCTKITLTELIFFTVLNSPCHLSFEITNLSLSAALEELKKGEHLEQRNAELLKPKPELPVVKEEVEDGESNNCFVLIRYE
jgi:hypothetical protein